MLDEEVGYSVQCVVVSEHRLALCPHQNMRFAIKPRAP